MHIYTFMIDMSELMFKTVKCKNINMKKFKKTHETLANAYLQYQVCTRSSNLCADLLVLTPRMKNKTSQTEYWCQWSWVQDDLCCICFLIDCLLQLCTMEKGGFIHQPAVMSFYMHTLFGGLGISNELSLRKRHRWATIMSYYMSGTKEM